MPKLCTIGIFLILFHFVIPKELFAIDKSYGSSPLDTDALTEIDGLRATAAKGNAIPKDVPKLPPSQPDEVLTVKGVDVPDCARGCTQYLFKTLDVAFRSGNNFERFVNVCDRFNETIVCLANLEHCGTIELFNTLSSGMKYMCIEQREAFAVVIECIDENANDVKDSCGKSCNAHGIFTGWAVYAALRDTMLFSPQIGNIPSKVNVAFFRKMTGEGCGVLQCYLGCLRSKYNDRCYGIGGSLLSEVLVRPAVEGQDSILLSPLSNFARLMLPDECGFFMSKSGLDPYRIDPKLNEDLKRTYARNIKKKNEFAYILPNSTHPIAGNSSILTNSSIPIPSPKITKDLAKQRSPLEDNNFDRDDLWRTALTSRRRSRALSKAED